MADDTQKSQDLFKVNDLSVPTYTTGLLQAQAYRGLSHFLSSRLKVDGLNLPEWTVLGLLNDLKTMRLSSLAQQMHVEASLITALVNKLVGKQLVERIADPDDSRAKQVRLTPEGQETTARVEQKLRRELREYLADISSAELVVYLNVMAKLANKINTNSHHS